jgi:hypothetical protein
MSGYDNEHLDNSPSMYDDALIYVAGTFGVILTVGMVTSCAVVAFLTWIGAL